MSAENTDHAKRLAEIEAWATRNGDTASIEDAGVGDLTEEIAIGVEAVRDLLAQLRAEHAARAIAEADRKADVMRLTKRLEALGDNPDNGRQIVCGTCGETAWSVCTHTANAAQFGADRERELRAAAEALTAAGVPDDGTALPQRIQILREDANARRRDEVLAVIDEWVGYYPADLFPPDGTSIDAKSGTFARHLLGLVRGQLVKVFDGREDPDIAAATASRTENRQEAIEIARRKGDLTQVPDEALDAAINVVSEREADVQTLANLAREHRILLRLQREAARRIEAGYRATSDEPQAGGLGLLLAEAAARYPGALAGLTEEQRRHLVALAADPARRARFNAPLGDSARIELLSVLAHPHRPEAARAREHLNAEFGLSIKVEDLARALGISPEDMLAIEVGTKTTDDAGWKEILTACFLLGSGTAPEHIIDPASSPAFQRAMTEEEPTCPGPDCPMCNGEACALCGAGTRDRSGEPDCEHDVEQRHTEPTEEDAPEETDPAGHSPEAMWSEMAATVPKDDEGEPSKRAFLEAQLGEIDSMLAAISPKRVIEKAGLEAQRTEAAQELARLGKRDDEGAHDPR